MTIDTELARMGSVDLGRYKETFSGTKSAIGAVSGGLSALYGSDEDVMKAVNMACGALEVLTGFASLGRLAKMATESRTIAKTIEAGALTSLNAALGPAGWTKIGIASASMATAGAVLYATVNTVRLGKFDLSTSSGQSMAVQKVTEAMA